MNERYGHRYGVVRRVLLRNYGKVIVTLAAAFTFGAIDQYLGALQSSLLTEVSVMSAPWLLVPFLGGASQAGPRRAAFLGLAATWLSVLAYVIATISPLEGTHLGARPAGLIGSWNQLSAHLFLVTLGSQRLWFAGGLISGPLYGWLGYWWRTRRSWAAALLAALPLLLEPIAWWLAARSGLGHVSGPFQGTLYSPAALAEAAFGLILTGVVVMKLARGRARPRSMTR
jgi:hypothetical protein